ASQGGGTAAEFTYLLVADALLLLHFLFVAFVILGLIVILLGKPMAWSFVRNWWFRMVHLASIGIVVIQSWLGVICPLTLWESSLREKAGVATYDGAFIAHWLQEVLYYSAPPWVFIAIYTIFGALVVASWFLVPPQRRR
ncbi:MAG: DUF2784 domain-containing protein, partial [Pseudomonadales bacterium]